MSITKNLIGAVGGTGIAISLAALGGALYILKQGGTDPGRLYKLTGTNTFTLIINTNGQVINGTFINARKIVAHNSTIYVMDYANGIQHWNGASSWVKDVFSQLAPIDLCSSGGVLYAANAGAFSNTDGIYKLVGSTYPLVASLPSDGRDYKLFDYGGSLYAIRNTGALYKLVGSSMNLILPAVNSAATFLTSDSIPIKIVGSTVYYANPKTAPDSLANGRLFSWDGVASTWTSLVPYSTPVRFTDVFQASDSNIYAQANGGDIFVYDGVSLLNDTTVAATPTSEDLSGRIFVAGDTANLYEIIVSAASTPYQPTSSRPYRGQSAPIQQTKQADNAPIQRLPLNASPGLGQSTSTKAAKSTSIQTLSPTSSPSLTSKSITPQSSYSSPDGPKGYKNGYLAIIPEENGYAKTLSLGTGNKVYLLSDSLTTGKDFKDLPTVGGKQTKVRANLKASPRGAFTQVLRSNDSIPLLMSHFQNRNGTTPSTGTTLYEFYPSQYTPRFNGNSFGTGTYGNSTLDAFTVSVFKAIEGTGYHYKSGVCDSLKFSIKTGEEAVVSPTFNFADVAIVGTSTLSNICDYSTLPHYESGNTSINFLGLGITDFEFEGNNNLKQINPVGTNTSFYQFGRYEVKGKASIDVPKSALAYIGSMLGTVSFNVYGTFFNDNRDKIVFQMPNCRLDSYEYNLAENLGNLQIPFRAYESEDGLTPPLKLMVWTRNYSATTFQPN